MSLHSVCFKYTHADSDKNATPLGHVGYAAALVRDPSPLGLKFSVEDVNCAIDVCDKNTGRRGENCGYFWGCFENLGGRV